MPQKLLQYVHPVKGLDAVADAFSGTVYSDVVNVKNYRTCTFIVHKAVGATGTSTITVLAGSDAADPPTASTAIPFRYKAMTSTDIEGALTDATTSGFATTAGSSQLYLIEVDCDELGDTGYSYLCLKAVEVVDSPVLGGIIILLSGARFAQDVPATAIT